MAKRNVKSSKTDHVLNMITSTNAESEQSTSEQKKIVPPVIEVASTKNDELSDTIDNALRQNILSENETQESESTAQESDNETQELSSESTAQNDEQAEVSPQAEGEQVSEQTSTNENLIKEQAQNESEQQVSPVSEEKTQDTAQNATQDAAQNASTAQSESEDEINEETSGIFVNIMEEIVDELKPDYMKKFKMCTCQRCQSDVKAYALTNLPAKYVVLSKSTLTPMMGFYNSRYATDVKSKLIVACKVVSDSPRHGGFRNNY